jgi:hypothetical protein
MDIEEARNQVEDLFWGVTAPFEPKYGKPGIKPIGMAEAVGSAIAILYAREIEEVRAALGRIEAGLPHESVSSLIQKERATLERLEAEVASLMRERPAW